MSENPSASKQFAAQVDQIPVIGYEPKTRRDGVQFVIWLPGLSMTKEAMNQQLQDLAGAGFVALSFDPWQHGARGTESGQAFITRVFGNFRRYMWPIIGQTTLDTLRVIDWAVSELGVNNEVYMGGLSMGGDIAIAAAGIEPRIKRVAALVATPDWLRPGMQAINNSGTILPPGTPDAYAQYFYDTLNPLTHLEHYARSAHGPAITFECGADDTHVPADGAQRFQAAFRQQYPALAERIRVNLIPDAGHMDSMKNPAFWQNALAWFSQ
ncbi:MAG: prolyl oligopeptidase family serine peptidase [Chloroflexota bacterium]